MVQVVGLVLAGGRSSRFGSDKARAVWHSKALLLHAIDTLSAVCDRVAVVVGDETRYRDLLPAHVQVVVDATPHQGPLEGLRAGLATLAAGQIALVAPCDVVGVDATWLAELPRALSAGTLAAAFRHADTTGKASGWEPLHAAYQAELLAHWRDHLPADLRSPSQLLRALGPRARAVALPNAWHDRVRRIDTPADLHGLRGLPDDRTATVDIAAWREGATTLRADTVAVELPLEIRLHHGPVGGRRRTTFAVTLRTPGHDPDLIAGLLLAEGVVRSPEELPAIAPCAPHDTDGAVWAAELAPTVAVPDRLLDRRLVATAACGLCGKGSLAALFPDRPPALAAQAGLVTWSQLAALPEAMRGAQAGFDQTGGVHAAAVFDREGHLLCLREDVGRHNAVDKALGHLWRAHRLADAAVLVLSGRAGFELVQKAAMAGVPVVAAIGAPTALAIDLAYDAGITLVGFLRGAAGNAYTHPRRIA
ncbi:MAG: formate dehydrogenase accessory sulfurtransferase FdhD [Deltaproteobacteria bacterium]|nr:formate dehydrogenase accessory sulfurtransferase FdhD [Deltaproteobacteria bacterium]